MRDFCLGIARVVNGEVTFFFLNRIRVDYSKLRSMQMYPCKDLFEKKLIKESPIRECHMQPYNARIQANMNMKL